MDLRQLRYLLALYEHRSFVQAAEAMGITQPAFSRAIQGLEQELGCALVARGSKDLRPTPEGQVALQHARNLVRGASNLVHEIGRMTHLDAGELQLGCSPALSGRWLSRALARFTTAHPNVHVRLKRDSGHVLRRCLGRDDIEFFIADIRPYEAEADLQTRPLRVQQASFFCRPGHPLLDRDSLSTNDLFAHPIATPRLPPVLHKTLAHLSGRAHFEPQLECEDLGLIVDLVRHTDTLGLGAREAVQGALDRGELETLHLRNVPPAALQLHDGIVSRTGYRLSAAAQALVDLLLDEQRAPERAFA